MTDRERDRSPHGRDDGDPPDVGQSKPTDQTPDDGSVPTQRRKAETEIAAGDVADDLADFA
ncbi:hypothetical protein MKK88_16735 [Methylobacterium sp. E-005]|uniref:hypothetical protein n=1 Tax=Methylobacterium sp. E-005 TaxID=2836549 RepID=UPI001FBB8434|nr:hypothetical protein [Methylobacterium sp. E-005]MCJ2087617.1 hypothetical protein [Methylobacterium sp. E-005]